MAEIAHTKKGDNRHFSQKKGTAWICRWCHVIATTALLLGCSSAFAQVPADGLRAEGERRWRDALAIYDAVLRDHPDRSDLWLREADIHAALGDSNASIHALEQAVGYKKGDATLYVRLSQAYAADGKPAPALLAIQGALALEPDNPEYLKAAGQLAAWKGDYDAAHGAYLRLSRLQPEDAEVWLALARTDVWQHQSDRAAGAYKNYVTRRPDDRTGWIEWARTESWRGNDAGALRVLDRMERRLGAGPDLSRERASVLARASRPSASLNVLRPLLASAPQDVDLRITDTLARIGYGDERGARTTYGSLHSSPEPTKQVHGLAQQLRLAFGSLAQPSVNAYSDSDGLRIVRIPASLSIKVAPGIRIDGGYQRDILRARTGSGLDSIDGAVRQQVDQGWVRAEFRPAHALQFRAGAGAADSAFTSDPEPTYTGGVTLQSGDALRLSYDRDHNLLLISPRTVSLGLTRDSDRAQLTWSPSVSFTLDADALRESFSDDNTRYAFRLAPRTPLLRRDFMNVDVGAAAYVFGARRNLDDGYYDPRRYEAYTFTVYPYLKFSENYGLSLFAEAGVQRDSTQRNFRPGGSVVGELTLGIYNAWVLKVNGGITRNNRLDSGAFRGTSGAVVLVRRF
jgi:tetratricopeptide (TPR) repeat protein